MDAIWDYIISRATDPGWRIAIGLFFTAGLILLCLILWWIARRKYEGRCTARAVGTIVSAEDEKPSVLNDTFPQREIVIRYRVGEREITVTDYMLQTGFVFKTLFGSNEVDRGKRLGDKVVIFYNPRDPREHIFVYSGGRYNHILLSPLGQALIALIAVAVVFFWLYYSSSS